jgi:hypothetical protein
MSSAAKLRGSDFDSMVERGAFDSLEPMEIELVHGELRFMNPAGPTQFRRFASRMLALRWHRFSTGIVDSSAIGVLRMNRCPHCKTTVNQKSRGNEVKTSL